MRGDKSHMIKLFIINNPKVRNQKQIAYECKCERSYVSRMLKDLNIPTTGKMDNCKG